MFILIVYIWKFENFKFITANLNSLPVCSFFLLLFPKKIFPQHNKYYFSSFVRYHTLSVFSSLTANLNFLQVCSSFFLLQKKYFHSTINIIYTRLTKHHILKLVFFSSCKPYSYGFAVFFYFSFKKNISTAQ